MGILISAYIDEEVTEEEKHLVEGHLHDCATCREMLEDFSTLHTLSQKLQVKEASQGFRQRVTQRIDKKPRLAFSWRRLPRLVYIVSLALLLFVGGTIMTVQHFQQEQTAVDVVEIEVYAEDFLFGQSFSAEESFFSAEYDINTAEEILDSIDFSDTDTSKVDESSQSV